MTTNLDQLKRELESQLKNDCAREWWRQSTFRLGQALEAAQNCLDEDRCMPEELSTETMLMFLARVANAAPKTAIPLVNVDEEGIMTLLWTKDCNRVEVLFTPGKFQFIASRSGEIGLVPSSSAGEEKSLDSIIQSLAFMAA